MDNIQDAVIFIEKTSLVFLNLGIVLHEQLGKDLRRTAVARELDARTRP